MESESDLNSLGSTLASLFMWRSKPSQPTTWLRRWKREPWVKELSGRILKPSQSKSFEGVLIFCLGDSLASPSPKPASAEEMKTSDTSSPTSSTESKPYGQLSLSSKTSKESSQLSSKATIGETQQEPQFCSMSLESWNEWVTEQRQSRRARQKSVLLTSETGGSLLESWMTIRACEWKGNGPNSKQQGLCNQVAMWPTTAARDWKGCGNAVQRKDGHHRLDTLEAVVMYGPPAPDKSNSDGSRLESWATGQTRDAHNNANPSRLERHTNDLNSQVADARGQKLNPRWVETLMGRPVGWTMPSCVNPVTIVPMNCDSSETESCLSPAPMPSGEGCENWATPNTMDYMEQRSPEALKRQSETTRKGRTKPANLREQVNPQAVAIYKGTP